MDLGPIDLDLTLDCGQAFRWRRTGDVWTGVVSERVVRLQQAGRTIDVETELPSRHLESYFRTDDDLDEIGRQLDKDERVRALRKRFGGLRLLRQEPWECSASFLLATNANVPRIKKMIESVCSRFGEELEPGLFSFPKAERIVEKGRETEACGLGYRCGRFLRFARHAAKGDLTFDDWIRLPYERCANELMGFEGIGNKVADCILLFCLDHLEAFPVDVRIKRTMEEAYGIVGSYRAVSGWARQHFGDYAGYAQEYLYLESDPRR
jgi:N-glycosylase/DNA lyase